MFGAMCHLDLLESLHDPVFALRGLHSTVCERELDVFVDVEIAN